LQELSIPVKGEKAKNDDDVKEDSNRFASLNLA